MRDAPASPARMAGVTAVWGAIVTVVDATWRGVRAAVDRPARVVGLDRLAERVVRWEQERDRRANAELIAAQAVKPADLIKISSVC